MWGIVLDSVPTALWIELWAKCVFFQKQKLCLFCLILSPFYPESNLSILGKFERIIHISYKLSTDLGVFIHS